MSNSDAHIHQQDEVNLAIPRFTESHFCQYSSWFRPFQCFHAISEFSESGDNVKHRPAFPFMRLPMEIRIMIYELLLVSPVLPGRKIFYGITSLPAAYKTFERLPEEYGHRLVTANLLRASKALYKEAWPVLLKNNTLVLGYGDYKFEMRELPERFIPHVRTVELHLDGGELAERLGEGYGVRCLEDDIGQHRRWGPNFHLDFEKWDPDSKAIRLEAIHDAQTARLCAVWRAKFRNIAILRPETWIINVSSCYCQHSCCRMAEEAIIAFCTALRDALLSRAEEELVHEESTPKFLITGLLDWEYQNAWETFNAVYSFPQTDQTLRQGKRVPLRDLQERSRKLDPSNMSNEEWCQALGV